MARVLRSAVVLAAVACVLTILTCVGVPVASAQVSTGSISGTVTDPQGGAIPSAAVKAVLVANNEAFTTTTDNDGFFKLSSLPIGIYRVEIVKDGFRKLSIGSAEVVVAADRGLGILKLEVGEQTSTVEVSAAAPLMESTEAQVTNTFAGLTLSTFVGIQENQGLDNLALFIPGVVSARDQGFSNTNGGVGFSVDGIRGRNNDQEIDGQNNNDNSVAGPALFLSDTEFVSQYNVITNNFGAEYGRNGGSVVNIVTKSGTNVWHGSVYGTENNSVMNSLSAGTIAGGAKEPPRANEVFFGSTVGGPIVKNKMFLFGGYDTDLVSTSSVFATGLPTPTPNGLATLAGCVGAAGSTVNGNAVAALTRFGPYGQTIGNPTPLNPTTLAAPIDGCSGVEVGGITRTVANPNHSYNFVTRFDYQVTSKDTFSARYLFNKTITINSSFDNPDAGYFLNIPALSQNVLLSETHTFGTRMTNDFRVGFGRLSVQFGGSSNGTDPTDGNILNPNVLTDVAIGGANIGFGTGNAFPQGRIVDTWQVQDNWSYLVGRHQFKAGVNFTHELSPNTFLPNVNGFYFFNSLNQYLTAAPAEVGVTVGDASIDFKESDVFLYFSDDFKVKQNLTLNLGLTWSYFSQPDNLLNQLDTINEKGPKPLFNPALPLSIRTTPTIPVYEHAFGPSIGFAYTPKWGGRLFGNDKTVIRGGYRLAYDPPYYNIYLNNYDGTPNVLSATFVAPQGSSLTSLPLPAVPTGAAVRALTAPLLPLGQLDPRDFAQVVIPQNFRPDEVNSWSLGIQREISSNLALEIRYAGNHASDLFQSVNQNPFVGTAGDPGLAQTFPNLLPKGVTGCTAAQAAGAFAVGRVNCNEGIELSRNNSGNSSYNAIQTELRANNLFHQLTMRAAYTFSKTLDNASEIFGTGGAGTTTSLAQNPFDTTRGEYGLSGLDIPHQFSILATEQLPFYKGQQGLLGHLLGGWALSGNYIWASGQPYTPTNPLFPVFTGICDCFDSGFNGNFNGGQAAARPFVGSLNAPANTVGIFAGDACTLLGVGCSTSTTQLISLNAANNGTVTNVTNSQVRFIANTGIAETTFGTPFGNAPRNALRDAPTNFTNFSVYKTLKFNERANLQFHITAENVFNHANYSSVVPDSEFAGIPGFFTTFARPQVTGDNIPGTTIAASRRVFFGLIIRY
jgi:hypothetical protein